MKKLLFSLIVMAAGLVGVNAETNVVDNGKSEAFQWEFTLGGAGAELDGVSTVGLDLSLSVNPIKQLPSLWFGVTQGAYWEPNLSGSTDLSANWSWHLFGDLYLNTGAFGGLVYNANDNAYFRAGPEVTFQYYVAKNAFLYSGVQYDLITRKGTEGWRYSCGIGLAF